MQTPRFLLSLPRRQLLLLAAGATALGPTAWAQARTPLLMDGKKTLYQRVLSRPGAMLSPSPGGAAGKALEPFSVFFVYERKEEGGKPWLLVGAGSDGKTTGYVPEADVVPWRHSITLAFATPANRERVLFFRERDGVMNFMNSDNGAAESQKFMQQIAASKGALGPSSPVIAAEPEKYVDLKSQFYLLPVLDAASTLLKSGNRVRLVKVASITRDSAPAGGGAPAPAATYAGITNFNSAVVFVIDATSSMQPYIDRASKALEEVLKQADEAKVLNRVRFGLLGFQDDPKKAKGVEYLSKIFVDPAQNPSREQFMTAMGKLKATQSSTRAYAEDAYAAIDEALRKINWQNYGGRYIVYITDASAREGSSPFASTRLSTDQMHTQAQERGVAIYAMHLKTPEGIKDHATAESQFKRLSNWPGKGPLYFPVAAGDPAQFENDIKKMARALVEQVKSPDKTLASEAAPGKADAVQSSVDAVGRAMVLAYLGRQQGVRTPSMFEAWTSDRDVRDKSTQSLSVRVLLTKNQLSDLQSTLRNLLTAMEKSQIDPPTFFNQLRSAAVAMGRDPSKLGQGKAKNLEQAGLMSEFLDGLPYQSLLMKMDFDAWTNMGVGDSQAILDGIRSKVVLYQRFHDDVDRWVKLNPAASDGDRVYPVPIDELP